MLTNPRDPLNSMPAAAWDPSNAAPSPGDAAAIRFTGEDVAEEAVLDPLAKIPPANTIPGGAHGWRQRRRLRSRWYCR